ncbi:MAG: Lrp/AsnC family transcriptional regulator [Burkholderia sp.]|jgi:DNA-binding Lrp family transcriptional regulator|uniref:Lrp/AsnC family transcriptional regulator n=1 Tax=Burkholderia sp. TaxID=36773 RepID=UPI0028178CED|nr:Lrp/AsnC family transcriptional regulator [Burkholderia sp.]MDR0240428.1 Lrp/AsnC family transcriptional regulator [Burkholderia sp.]
MKIDGLDQKIIDALCADARIPLAVLADRIGLSRQAVRHRIDRLEALKIIVGYTVRLSLPDDTLPVRAVMLVYRKDRMRGADVLAALERIAEVRDCSVLSGEVDLLVQIEATSHERVSEIWGMVSAMDGVQNITTSFVLDSVVHKR